MGPRKVLFIGSSTNGLMVARELEKILTDAANVIVWKEAFRLGEVTITGLMRQLDSCAYAVLVATADDVVDRRGQSIMAPRDNVIFEAGLFLGRLGSERAFLVCSEEAQRALPTDLAGIIVATFDENESDLKCALLPAARQVQAALELADTAELDFVRSYLTFIHPNTLLTASYSQILTEQYNKIDAAFRRVQKTRDWETLLEIKKRLREYFEFSGSYKAGAEFGEAYVEALQELGQPLEAVWAEIKDVGYMLILDGNYVRGRQVINEALERLMVLQPVSSPERNQAAFYGHRYKGISYQRQRDRRLDCARDCFEAAAKCLEGFETDSQKWQALRARLDGNLGNLALDKDDPLRARDYFVSSLRGFESVEDEEHIGIAHLNIGKAITRMQDRCGLDPVTHLEHALRVFGRLGWCEGQGRVHEQFALYYEKEARVMEGEQRAELYQQALNSANNALAQFEWMRSPRWMGRIEGLIDRLEGELQESRRAED